MSRSVAVLIVLSLAGLAALPASGHEIPGRAEVELAVADDADAVRIVARVPLGALQDLTLPLRSDGTLVLERAEPVLRDAAALWVADFLEVRVDDDPLPPPRVRAVRASRPSAAPLADFDAARTHVAGPPLPPGTRLRPAQAHLDALLVVEVPAARRDAVRSLVPRLAHLGVTTRIDLSVRTRDGGIRRLTVDGSPGALPLDPGAGQVLGSFAGAGVEHILGGLDHLLFLLCLLLPGLAWRPLLAMITAFTAGHTVTLLAAALGWAPRGAWFPALTETLVAASVVWLALASLYRVLRPGAVDSAAVADGRWRPAFLFGLVHGFGFAVVLAGELQFSGEHLILALLSFNLGVEAGQLLFLVVAVPLLRLLLAHTAPWATIALLAALVLHTAWHWMLERGAVFAAYPLTLPAADLVFLRGCLQAALLAVVILVLHALLARLARALGLEPEGVATSSGVAPGR